jgi:arginase
MKLAVLGVPSSIGARNPGTELAPAALRRSGLVERIRSGGAAVEDLGDLPRFRWAPDPDPAHRKCQNREGVIRMAALLSEATERALRSGARLLLLGGDCTLVLGSFTGATRVHPDLGLVYLDRDAELNTPQSTRTGILDGMVLSHLLGRGDPDLARLDGRAPVLRPGRLALVGVDRLDPQEVPVYEALPSFRAGAGEVLESGAERILGEILRRAAADPAGFFVHLDLDVLDGSEMPAVGLPASGGIPLRTAGPLVSGLLAHPGCRGIEVTNYEPERDPDGAAASRIVELLAGAFRPAGSAAPRREGASG